MRKEYNDCLEQCAYASAFYESSTLLKIMFSLSVLLLCNLLDHVAVSLFVIVSMLLLITGIGGMGLRSYLRLLGIPMAFLLFSGFALLFAAHDLQLVAGVTLRTLGSLSAFYFLILSTPAHEFFMGMRRCHVPGLLIDLMYLIYRFIFVLTEMWETMHRAAQSRLGFADYSTSLHTFGSLAANLFVLSVKRADDFYNAMEARCYEGRLCFLEESKHSSLGQWLAVGVYLCALLGIGRICR